MFYRGYGFVRFSDEIEHRKAMIEMQGAVGCGSKPLRVSAATPKRYHATLCYHSVVYLTLVVPDMKNYFILISINFLVVHWGSELQWSI